MQRNDTSSPQPQYPDSTFTWGSAGTSGTFQRFHLTPGGSATALQGVNSDMELLVVVGVPWFQEDTRIRDSGAVWYNDWDSSREVPAKTFDFIPILVEPGMQL